MTRVTPAFGDVSAERRAGEAVNRIGQVVFARVPEAREISSPLIGWIAAPQQLASHLVREADQERFGKRRIGEQHGDEVGVRNRAQTRYEPVAIVGIERFVHRPIHSRCSHDRRNAQVVEPVRREPIGDLGQARFRIFGHSEARCDGAKQSRCRQVEPRS